MNKRIAAALTGPCGLRAGDHITVALSGGRDSVVLAHALLAVAGELGLTLSALHIHHGLRSASDGEEQFVRELCRSRNLPLSVRRLQITPQKGESLEMAARAARYAVFAEYVGEGRYVATAHHLDDCMETFFINLCRGCGSKGLSAIPHQRDGIIRPLLDCPGETVQAYAEQQGLQWVEDESNADTYYLRNFIRHEILPRLKGRQDVSFTAGFAATLSNLREENEFLEQAAGTEELTHRPLAWRVLKARCPALTRERFEQIYGRIQAGEKSFEEQVQGDLFARWEKGRISFYRRSAQRPIPLQKLEETLSLSDKKTIYLKEIHSEFTNFDMDCDKIGDTLYISSRKAGDEITLPRRPRKSLKKLFAEEKVKNREEVAVIRDGQGVLWVEGFGADERCAPDGNTKRAYRVVVTTTDKNK